MNQENSFNAYEQLIEAARTPNSQLTGPEDQQMALQNASQAQQAGHSPSLLYRTPYDTLFTEPGLGRVHRQHSHQQQRQEQPPHHRTHRVQTDLGPRQQQPPHHLHYPTYPVQMDLGPRQQQPPHHQHYPAFPVQTYLGPQQDQSQPPYHQNAQLIRTRSYQPQPYSYHEPKSLQTDHDQPPLLSSQPHQTGFDQPSPLNQQENFFLNQSQPDFTSRGTPSLSIHNNQPVHEGRVQPRPQRGPRAPPNPVGRDFEKMSRKELRDWNREQGLPITHTRQVLIKQAKTRSAIKVVPWGRRRERNVNLEGLSVGNAIPLESDTTELEVASAEDAIEIDSDVGLTEYTCEFPEGTENQDDANEPGMCSYTYDSPTAEEEAAMNQSYATPQHGDPEDPTSLDNAGPSTSNP